MCVYILYVTCYIHIVKSYDQLDVNLTESFHRVTLMDKP
jgi:hypothetical protein